MSDITIAIHKLIEDQKKGLVTDPNKPVFITHDIDLSIAGIHAKAQKELNNKLINIVHQISEITAPAYSKHYDGRTSLWDLLFMLNKIDVCGDEWYDWYASNGATYNRRIMLCRSFGIKFQIADLNKSLTAMGKHLNFLSDNDCIYGSLNPLTVLVLSDKTLCLLSYVHIWDTKEQFVESSSGKLLFDADNEPTKLEDI